MVEQRTIPVQFVPFTRNRPVNLFQTLPVFGGMHRIAHSTLFIAAGADGRRPRTAQERPDPPQAVRRPRKWSSRRRPTPDDTRMQLTQLLRQHPPAVGEVLQRDPSLLNRPDYLAPYPALVAFLQQHPEIARNPSYLPRQLRILRARTTESIARDVPDDPRRHRRRGRASPRFSASSSGSCGRSSIIGDGCGCRACRPRCIRSSSIGSQQTRICSRISSRQRDGASWSRRRSRWIRSRARRARRSRASSGRCRRVWCWRRSGPGSGSCRRNVSPGGRGGLLHHRRAGVSLGVGFTASAVLAYVSRRGWVWSPGRRVREA